MLYTVSLTVSATDDTWSNVLPTPPPHTHTHSRFSPQPGNTVQLSASGYQFLTDLFRKYDKDGDNALSTAEQEVSYLCPLTFSYIHYLELISNCPLSLSKRINVLIQCALTLAFTVVLKPLLGCSLLNFEYFTLEFWILFSWHQERRLDTCHSHGTLRLVLDSLNLLQHFSVMALLVFWLSYCTL